MHVKLRCNCVKRNGDGDGDGGVGNDNEMDVLKISSRWDYLG